MVKLPDSLPENLKKFENAETEKDLVDALLKNRDEAKRFFIAASKDETWSSQHYLFHERIFLRLTESLYQGKLSQEDCRLLVQAIQEHLGILRVHLYAGPPRTFDFLLDDGEETLSTFLGGCYSRYLYNLIRDRGWREKKWSFRWKGVRRKTISLLRTFLEENDIPYLSREKPEEITDLMGIAQQCEIPALVGLCTETLRRYIDRKSVIPMLIAAYEKDLREWKVACYQTINESGWGLSAPLISDPYLHIGFNRFSESALEAFRRLAPLVTHLGFEGELIAYPLFLSLIEQSPSLIGLDLGNSRHFHENLLHVPREILHLDLGGAPWVTDRNFIPLVEAFSSLTALDLHNAIHLSFVGWGKLAFLRSLEKLCLAGCSQIVDEEMRMILRSIPRIRSLDLQHCYAITDFSIRDIPSLCSQIEELDLSGCQAITDASIVEIAYHARHLSALRVAHCPGISEKGILTLIHTAPELRSLAIEGIFLTEEGRKELVEKKLLKM